MQGDTNILVKGATGVASTAGGIVVSNLAHIEAWLRITSLCVGIAVGILTGVSIIRKMSKNRKGH